MSYTKVQLEEKYRKLKAEKKEIEERFQFAEVSRRELATETIELHKKIEELEKKLAEKDEEISILKQPAPEKSESVNEEVKTSSATPGSDYEDIMAALIAYSKELEQSKTSATEIDFDEADNMPEGTVQEYDSYGRKKSFCEIMKDALSYRVERPDQD